MYLTHCHLEGEPIPEPGSALRAGRGTRLRLPPRRPLQVSPEIRLPGQGRACRGGERRAAAAGEAETANREKQREGK